MTINGTHDGWLVALSVLVAIAASYTALDLASRLMSSTGRARIGWLFASALAMGGGIWSMHFVAMLAFVMPTPVGYDLSITVISLLLPIVVAAAAFAIVSRWPRSAAALIGSGLFLGGSIVLMHYMGMAAMRMSAAISYDRFWVAVSILIAIGAATVALWLAGRTTRLLVRIAAAVVMGFAVSGMHYVAMVAATFSGSNMEHAHGAANVNPTTLALAVAALTFIILFLGWTAALFDRRLVESALKESEARFRLMADAVPQIVWITDANGCVEFFNKYWFEYTGVAREPENAAQVAAEYLHPDDAAPTMAALDAAKASGGTFLVEHRIRSASGEYRWFLVRGEPSKDAATGKITRWFGASVDIHDRKADEQALRELNRTLERRVAEELAARRQADALYRAYFENAPEALFVVAVTPEGNFIAEQINPAHEAAVGFRLEEVQGRRIEDILPSQAAAQVLAAYRKVVETGDILQYREAFELGGGTSYWDTSLVPVRTDGQVVRIIGSSRDVTRQVVAEEALRQSQKMEAIGQLTGGVAHDFNNLLTIIRSSTDLLRRPGLTEERRRRYIDAIAETVDVASRLTSQLLAFARRQALKPEVFDPAKRIWSVAEMLRSLVGGRIDVRTDFECADCFIEADPSQFETALVNVALNARDAMEGEGCLSFRVFEVDGIPAIRRHAGAQGRYVAIEISDTGIGIPAESIDAIFEPFFTTKEVGKGTGLGLSQVYGFVKQSGGNVRVESEIGKGTVLTLYLPRAAAQQMPADPPERKPSRALDGGQGRRVLVVEDNQDVGAFSTRLLEDMGYEPIWAAGADAALKYLTEGKKFDVVFTDVVMPGMGGVELALLLRERYPTLPVVLTSGYSHVLAEEGRYGFDLLHKPYAAEELSEILQRAIARN